MCGLEYSTCFPVPVILEAMSSFEFPGETLSPLSVFSSREAPVSEDSPFHSRWNSLSWNLVQCEPCNAALNLAIDEALVESFLAGNRGPTVRIWNWTEKCVVLGRFQSVSNEVDEQAAARHGVSLARRMSGGGSMYVEPEGAITWSVYAPDSLISGLDIVDSYAFFDSWVVEALKKIGIEAFYRPVNDIACPEGKMAGAAQARRGNMVLHHATMAYSMNQAGLKAVLRTGKDAVVDRGIRSAVKTVASIDSQISLGRLAVIEVMLETLASWCPLRVEPISVPELERAGELARTKYRDEAWIRILP